MTTYIDKEAIVAEIERLKRKSVFTNFDEGVNAAAQILLDVINTLEVKESKEQPVSEDLEEAIVKSFICHENHGDDFRSDKQIETAYRFGFEDGVKYKESISIIEDVGKQNLEIFELGLRAQKGGEE